MPNLGRGSEGIFELVILYVAAFLLSFMCFASIKVFVMTFVACFYGGGFLWVGNDTRFVLVSGTLLGLVFVFLQQWLLCEKMIHDAIGRINSISSCAT
ncbi:hypothetical protein [Burkholderia sp. IMCC1007]|uniref:hypothetical protein n=1 Tax=Burkholderia sp. IMCC1007 TaxID=3004104 RepID=UPI0022B3AB88|nr:hypothetical protein [Burkholderia sp. IMCC1007]